MPVTVPGDGNGEGGTGPSGLNVQRTPGARNARLRGDGIVATFLRRGSARVAGGEVVGMVLVGRLAAFGPTLAALGSTGTTSAANARSAAAAAPSGGGK